LLPELALIAATIAYGSTFVIVQNALDHVTPVGFILLRFSIGAIVLAPIAFRRGFRRPGVDTDGRAFVVAAVAFGLTGFAGYWFQNAGLQRTTTSNSAFITGLFVVFTPMIEVFVTRRAPDRRVLYAIAVSAVGLFLLTGASFGVHAGDLLTLGGRVRDVDRPRRHLLATVRPDRAHRRADVGARGVRGSGRARRRTRARHRRSGRRRDRHRSCL